MQYTLQKYSKKFPSGARITYTVEGTKSGFSQNYFRTDKQIVW